MRGSELTLDHGACAECGLCVAVCAYDALVLRPTELEIIHEECVLCDACVIACPTEALAIE
ncbi:MAG TPA: 4Fe-4S binding protein [candidate division Zixibacteria bacterium]|jgi:MinD superfamily P-loop ATPase